MATFKDRVFGSQVDPKIIKKFEELAGGGTQTNILGEVKPTFKKYLGERTPFSRMWCAVNINKLPKTGPDDELIKRNSKGVHYYHPNGDPTTSKIVGTDADSETLVFSVNENREKSYDKNILESMQKGSTGNVRYISQLSEELGAGNPYMKPAAGITSVTSKTQGALGAIRSTVVEFIVHNRHDFENIFLPYFLRPGAVVCVDYGWSDDSFQLYDPINQIKDKTLDMSEFNKYIYHKETGFLIKNQGLVNTVMGNVVTYDASVNNDGSFQCSLEITSRNTGILDKELSDDNKLRFIFSNVIDDIIKVGLASTVGAKAEDLQQSLSIIKKSISGELSDELNKILTSKDYEDTSKDFLSKLNFGRAINDERSNTSLLSAFAKNHGVFYQDITNNKGVVKSWLRSMSRHTNVFDKLMHGVSTKETPKEIMYIAWGKFEDMFLNNFVVGTIGNKSTDSNSKENLYKTFEADEINPIVQYDSRESFVRWDDDLYQMQHEPLSSNDTLPTFIMPKTLEFKYNKRGDNLTGKASRVVNTYNVNVIKNTKKDLYDQPWFPKDCSEKATSGEFIGKKIIPFRDIFVSVNLISQAFSMKDNVNDALIYILDALNEDSYKIWNLKITSPDNSNSHITAYDSNLQPRMSDNPRDNLTFDITSETSIVSQCNLQFTTPKDGLGSMIAIDSLGTARHFKEHNMAALNNLNLLNQPKFTSGKKSAADQYVSVRSLPLQNSNDNTDEPALNLNFNRLNKSISTLPPGSIPGTRGTMDALGAFRKIQEHISRERQGNTDTKEEQARKNAGFDYGDADVVNNGRDIWRKQAKQKLYDDSDQDTISPILPIEIDLSIYGNNYLNIGDYFTVNYLPTQYKDRTYFQIVGIEDKIDPNGWSTSYTSVMRVNPAKKSIVSGFDYQKPSSKTKKKPPPVLKKEEFEAIYDKSGGKINGYSNYRKVDTFTGGEDELSFDIYHYKYSRVEQYRTSKKNGQDIYHQSPIGNLDDLKYTNNVAWAYTIRNILLNGTYLNRSDSVGEGGVDVFDDDGFWQKDPMDIGTKTYGDLLRGQGEKAVYKVFISDEDDVEDLINLFDPSNINEVVQEKFENAMQFVNKNSPKSLYGFTEVEFGVLPGQIPTIGGNVPFIGKFMTATTGIANDLVGGSTFPTFIRCLAIRSEKLKRHTEIHDKGGLKTEYDVGEDIFALQQTGTNGISVFPTLIIPKWVLRKPIGDLCQILNDTYNIYKKQLDAAMVFAGYKDSIKIVN